MLTAYHSFVPCRRFGSIKMIEELHLSALFNFCFGSKDFSGYYLYKQFIYVFTSISINGKKIIIISLTGQREVRLEINFVGKITYFFWTKKNNPLISANIVLHPMSISFNFNTLWMMVPVKSDSQSMATSKWNKHFDKFYCSLKIEIKSNNVVTLLFSFTKTNEYILSIYSHFSPRKCATLSRTTCVSAWAQRCDAPQKLFHLCNGIQCKFELFFCFVSTSHIHINISTILQGLFFWQQSQRIFQLSVHHAQSYTNAEKWMEWARCVSRSYTPDCWNAPLP